MTPAAASLAVARIVWRTGQVVPLVALLLAALACGVTLLYLRQTSRQPWPWRIVLMALRTLALTALAVSLLKPTLSRDAKPSEEGAVLVVVDRSHSMSLHDGQRQPGQLVALADGLGLIPSKLRSRGDEWIGVAADLNTSLTDLTDAQSRLAFARISGLNTAEAEGQVNSAAEHFVGVAQGALGRRPAPPGDTSLGRTMAKLRQAVEQPRGADLAAHWLPGAQAAVEAVADAAGTFQLDADKGLYGSDPQVRAACDRLAKMNRLQLVDEALTGEPSGLLYHLPDGAPVYGFAAGESVEPLPLRGPGGRPVRRLLVDANSSGTELGAAVRDAIDQMRGAAVRAVVLFSDGRQPRSHGSVAETPGVPVFAVSPAPFPGARGPAIRDLSIAESALPVAVCADETFTVRGRIYSVDFAAGREERVECLLDGAPRATAAVRLQRGGAATDVAFDLRVDAPGPHRVGLRLLPETGGEASNENNSAERWLKVLPGKSAAVTWAESPTWDWQLANAALSSAGRFDVRARSATTLPSTVPDDARAVLLFGPDPHAVTEPLARELDAFVRERGGLLVITASPDRPLSEYATPATLAELLPFALEQPATGGDWTAWYGDEPVYHFEPPDARPGERTRWASLPPLYRFASLPPLKPAAQPLLVERDTRAPVAARVPVGAGQVVFVGIDETWRWRYGDPAAAGRFWADLVRKWAEPPYAVTDGPLALDVERAAVEPHEPFGVRAKFAGGPASLAARVLGRDGAEVRRDVLPRTGPGRYAATLGGLPVGAYQVEVMARMAGGAYRMLRYPLHVEPTYANEAENPATSRDTLQHLADASGGRLLAMDELRQLPAALANTAEVRVVPVPLWDSTYLFVFVAACFCAEWALRKRLGLG